MLRGTPLDVFGYAGVRRVERELIGEYQRLVRSALDHLDAGTVDQVVELVELPDLVRATRTSSSPNVERYRERAAALLEDLAEARR